VPVSPGGVLPRDMNDRQWSDFLRNSGVQGDRSVKSFTPTWTGFASAPTAEISYMDFGAIVAMWEGTGSSVVGTSNSAAMAWAADSLPASIRPRGNRLVQCILINSTATAFGLVYVGSDGGVTFGLGNTTASSPLVVQDLGGFNSGAVNKGLAAGWLIMYPK
jgi:hypothetical protein